MGVDPGWGTIRRAFSMEPLPCKPDETAGGRGLADNVPALEWRGSTYGRRGVGRRV